MEKTLVSEFALGGYRSFGSRIQRFSRFAKVNLLIGPNNSGKSNVLRFIHSVCPALSTGQRPKLDQIDRHFPGAASFRTGLYVSLSLDKEAKSYTGFNEFVAPLLVGKMGLAGSILRVFLRKAELDSTEDAWFMFDEGGALSMENWEEAFATLNDSEMNALWHGLTGRSGGSRSAHWFPETLRYLTPKWRASHSEMIPAIRRVGSKGSESKEFGGEGIIERLARLQNPDVHSQADRERFQAINRFLQSVTDNESARIEVPYDRNTIVVHMDGKALPLESLGTGIHQVIILAAAATLLQNTVICMEEPELHLNPILQRKLVRYLAQKTSNQYFITTHSAALMDTPSAEVYHIRLEAGQSVAERVTSDRHRAAICEDLGYHPSDLLQANCLIWVEGPSDRVYLKYWLNKRDPSLQEGIHFAIMFYGGRLASHLSGHDIDVAVGDFISLRRLNRRGVIVIDSDRTKSTSALNATKLRLVEEFNAGPGHAWVTDGREIENYLPSDQVQAALSKVASGAVSASRFRRYDKVLSVKSSARAIYQAPKVEVAKHIVATFDPDENRLDLKKQIDALTAFIRRSNPSFEKTSA